MGRRQTGRDPRREVEGWRESGESAARYAAGRGYSASTLQRWAATPRRGAETAEPPRFLRLALEAARPPVAELVIEVGVARIRIASRGFDAALLRDVVAALGAGDST